MLPENLSLLFPVFTLRGGVGGGRLPRPPSQRALERRVVMKEAIDFLADFKEEVVFIPALLRVSGLGSALSQTCGL